MVTLGKALEYIGENIVTFTKNLIVAIIIILIGFIIAKTADRFVFRVLHEIELNQIIKKIGWKFNLEKFISKLLYYVIILITIVMALSQMQLATTIYNIVLVALGIFLIFIITVWLKYFIPNAFTGALLNKTRNYKKGDIIVMKDINIKGKVEKISLTETKIITKNKDSIYIPNSSIFKLGAKKST